MKTFQGKSYTHPLELNSSNHRSCAQDQRGQTSQYNKSIEDHHVMSVLLDCKNKNGHISNQMHFIVLTILTIEVIIKF